MTALDPVQWRDLILLGLLCGVVGQALRIVIGMRKLQGETADETDAQAFFSPSRLVLSLVYGGSAGALAAVLGLDTPDQISRDKLIGLVAAGYAGADFVEGAISRRIPKLRSGR